MPATPSPSPLRPPPGRRNSGSRPSLPAPRCRPLRLTPTARKTVALMWTLAFLFWGLILLQSSLAARSNRRSRARGFRWVIARVNLVPNPRRVKPPQVRATGQVLVIEGGLGNYPLKGGAVASRYLHSWVTWGQGQCPPEDPLTDSEVPHHHNNHSHHLLIENGRTTSTGLPPAISPPGDLPRGNFRTGADSGATQTLSPGRDRT